MNQARKFANTKNILIHQNFNRILTFDFGGVTLLRLMITLLRLMKCNPTAFNKVGNPTAFKNLLQVYPLIIL